MNYWIKNKTAVLACLLLVIFSGAAGGCALPRIATMDALVRHAVPVPPGGKRVDVHVTPWFSEPQAETRVVVQMYPGEADAWLKKGFEAQGWTYKPEYTSSRNDGNTSVRFTKPLKWWSDTLDPSLKFITLDYYVSAGPGGEGAYIEVRAYCEVNHWWHPLTMALYLPFYHIFGEKDFYPPLFSLF